MKKILYIFYFAMISNYFLPVGEVFAMAQDIVNPPYQVASNQYSSCRDFSSHSNDNAANIRMVFQAYGDASRGSYCEL